MSEAAPSAVSDAAERLRLFVDSVTDYAILMLDPQGRVASWNRGAQRIKGYAAEEIVGQHFSRFYPAEDVAAGKCERMLRTAAAEGHVEDEGWRVRKDGTRFWANVVITSVRDESGALRGFGKVTRDLTERKAAEEKIRRLNEDLGLHAARLADANADLEAFSYSVAHDIRAPLRQIAGYAQILEEEYGPRLDDEARRCLGKIVGGTEHLGALVDDLLNLAQVSRQPLQCRRVALEPVVREAISALEQEAVGRRVEWRVAPLFEANCDPGLIKQVFANLLSNALKYSRPRDPAVIEVGWTANGLERVVFIRDNGVGFDMKYAGKLFGVFQRLHKADAFEGTGVGLATVERIVRKHGGRIWAEAEPDKGATFRFTI